MYPQQAVSKLQVDLKKVVSKCHELRLTINLDKTKFIMNGSKDRMRAPLQDFPTIEGTTLSRVQNYCYMGVRLGETMTMEEAVKDVIRKVNHKFLRFSNQREDLSHNNAM